MSEQVQGRGTAATRRGAAIFAGLIALSMAVYGWSVAGTARNPGDWLMILPAAAVGIAALVWAAAVDLRAPPAPAPSPARAEGAAPATRAPLLLLALIVGYGFGLPILGFDIATAVFLALALLVQGERRLWLIALNALAGTALLVWIFHGLLAVRLPLTLL